MDQKKEQDKFVRIALWVAGVAISVFVISALAKMWLVHQALNELKAVAVTAVTSPASRKIDVIEPPRLIEVVAVPEPDLDALASVKAGERERAWLKFYRPSGSCVADPTTVECANAFIRAKRAFDSSY